MTPKSAELLELWKAFLEKEDGKLLLARLVSKNHYVSYSFFAVLYP